VVLGKDDVILFRGIKDPNNRTSIGRWWSTNPFYALKYGNIKQGQIFIAKIKETELKTLARDVSIEGHYKNYFFVDQDPPNARELNQKEIDQLMSFSIITKAPVGGNIFKYPDDPVGIARSIFYKL